MSLNEQSAEELNQKLDEIVQLLQKNGPTNLPEEKKRQFWYIVGKIKRMDKPDRSNIEKASNIREILHKDRFGDPIPTRELLIPFGISAILMLVGNIMFGTNKNQLFAAGIISYIGFALFFATFFIINGLIFNNKITTFLVIFGISVIEFIILYYYFSFILEWLVFYSAIAIIPGLYPFGRWIASKITKIKLEGGIRDVFYLVTLKTDYTSYLLASPKKRYWFFIISGSGTALTAILLSILEWILFSNYYFGIVALVLIILETFDYIFGGGRLAGEFGHARREKIIVKDWLKSPDKRS